MNKKLIVGAVLSVLSFGAMADNPSFDNIEIGYVNFDFGGGLDPDGFELKGSKQISDNFYIAGDYADTSINGRDLSVTTFGVGYKNDFSDTSSFFVELDYANFDGEGGDEDGFELTLGVRSMLTDKFEIKAGIEYLDIDNDDITSLFLGGAYDVTDSVAIYADYKYESDLSRYGVGVRFNF